MTADTMLPVLFCFQLNDHPFGKELFIRLNLRVSRERLSVFMCDSFPFGFEDGLWNLIVLFPDYCLSIYST